MKLLESRVLAIAAVYLATNSEAADLMVDGPTSVNRVQGADDPSGGGIFNGAWNFNFDLSDEFSDGDSFDTTKWQADFPGWHGMPPGAFSASNTEVENDRLSISARLDSTFNFPGQEESCSCPYERITTGCLYSKATIKYGYFEIRAQTANVDGLQSSFFLQGTKSEISVLEANGRSSKIEMTHHCFNSSSSNGRRMPVELLRDNQYHTYGVRILPSGITYYLDSVEVAVSQPGDALCADDEHHLILDLETVPTETSDFSTALINASDATFHIDYIRSWSIDFGCPAQSSDFFHPPQEGRLVGTSKFKIGDGYKHLSAEECAAECERVPECVAFERLERSGRCFLRSSTGREQGLKHYTQNDIWETYDRRATRCQDGTCLCPEFTYQTDAPTTVADRISVPPPTAPTAAPSHSPTAQCFSALSEQFSLFSSNRVLKKRWRYNLEKTAKVRVESKEECFRRCAHYETGVSCLAVEYSSLKKMCVLKTARGVAGNTAESSDRIHTKPNAKYDLYNRVAMCEEIIPDGICVTKEPLLSFTVTPRTRMRGAVPSTRANSVEDCAARCLAAPNTSCHSFSWVNSWGGCFLYGDLTNELISKPQHTFYSRISNSACVVPISSASALFSSAEKGASSFHASISENTMTLAAAAVVFAVMVATAYQLRAKTRNSDLTGTITYVELSDVSNLRPNEHSSLLQ